MNKWDTLRYRVNSQKRDSIGWRSEQRSLLKIFDYAEKADINPDDAIRAPLSNLSAIIARAKKSIELDRTQDLIELIKKAADLRNADLRLWLGTTDLREVKVEHLIKDGEEISRVSFSPDDFARVQRALRLQFRFMTDEEK